MPGYRLESCSSIAGNHLKNLNGVYWCEHMNGEEEGIEFWSQLLPPQ